MDYWKKDIIKYFPKHLTDHLITFLSPMKQLNIAPIELSSKLQENLNFIAGYAPIIFIFDIEFQHIRKIRGKESRHILEFGGILLVNYNNNWHYFGSFHFNLPPSTKIKNLGVIQSTYSSVTPKTEHQMVSLENNYLFYQVLQKYKNDSNKFAELYNYFINSKLAKKKKILYIEPSPENFNKIIRLFKDMSFTLGKNDIGDINFNKIWKLYLTDPNVQFRTIKPNHKWLNSFYELLKNSVPVVKGNMDLIALDNLMDKYKMDSISDKLHVFDIAIFNSTFRKVCNSAELEKSYWCLIEKQLIDSDIEPSLKSIFNNLSLQQKKLIAHNPLVDAFYTLVVAISMVNRFNISI